MAMGGLSNLKWTEYWENRSKFFSDHREYSDFFDVTLVTDDFQKISAHKLVLASSSNVFRTVLEGRTDKSLTLFLNDVSHEDLSLLMDFIYKGEVKVKRENVEKIIDLGKSYKIQGLMNQDPPTVNTRNEETSLDEDEKVKRKSFSNVKSEVALNDHQVSIFEPQTELSELADPDIGVDNYHEVRALSDKYIETLEDGSFSCSMCGKCGNLKHVIQYHVETHLDGLSFPCPVCDKKFKTRNSQRAHLSLKHRGADNLKQNLIKNPVKTEPDSPSFPCSLCDKKFKSRNSQRVHISTKHRGFANMKQRASHIALDQTLLYLP